MKTRITLFASLAAMTFSVPVFADAFRFTPHVNPYVNPQVLPIAQPRLDFQGTFVPGRGMLVNHVIFGGLAHRIGLECGDVIVAINGQRIRSNAHYRQLLQNAVLFNGGRVTLLVQNVRRCPAFVTLQVMLPCSGHHLHHHHIRFFP